jgi:hypothetical protein
MNGQIFWLTLLIVCGAIVGVIGLLLRVRPTDLSAIDNFAGQRGLRIVTVTRSHHFFRDWLRGISVDNAARSYGVTVENPEGHRGDIHVAFDAPPGFRQLVVSDPQGLVFDPGGSVRLTLSETRFHWSRDELLVLCVMGVCISGFFFCGILHTELSPPNRPILPEPALGYTHLLTARHGTVYGTLFEYLAVTYGVWIMWALGALIGLIFFNLKNKDTSRTYPRLPWQILAAAAISMPLYYAIWQLSLYVARS